MKKFLPQCLSCIMYLSYFHRGKWKTFLIFAKTIFYRHNKGINFPTIPSCENISMYVPIKMKWCLNGLNIQKRWLPNWAFLKYQFLFFHEGKKGNKISTILTIVPHSFTTYVPARCSVIFRHNTFSIFLLRLRFMSLLAKTICLLELI